MVLRTLLLFLLSTWRGSINHGILQPLGPREFQQLPHYLAGFSGYFLQIQAYLFELQLFYHFSGRTNLLLVAQY